MSRTWFRLAPLAILIIIGMLIAGGFVFYRISWLEGYRTGQMVAAGVADGTVVPYVPHQPGCGGLLLTLGAIFLLLLVVGKFFRFWAWRAAGGPGMMPHGQKSEYWARHWRRHRPHGPVPPWCWDWEEPSEEKAEEPKPDTDASDADSMATV
jgi:hypothetical protein